MMPFERMLLVMQLLVGAAAFDSLGFELDAQGCVISFDENTNYFPPIRHAMLDRVNVGAATSVAAYALHYEIEYFKTFKIVRNKQAGEVYVLHHCGTPISSITNLPADAVSARIFSVPVTEVSTDTTVTLEFLEMLGAFDKLTLTDMSYTSSACLKKLADCGDVSHISGDKTSPAYINTIEETSELHFVGSPAHKNLTKDVIFHASGDPSLLGRSQWLSFIGTFLNKEPLANQLFRGIQRSLDETESSVADVVRTIGSRPTIAFTGYSSWSGKWSVNRPDYKQEAIMKAGGQPLSLALMSGSDWTNSEWNSYDRETTSGEAFHKLLEHVDVLIDETYASDNTAYTLDSFFTSYGLSNTATTIQKYPFLQTGTGLYRLDGTVGQWEGQWVTEGMDWYEAGLVRPDIVVFEMARGAFPSSSISPPDNYDTTFFRNLMNGEVPIIRTKDDVDDPYCVCDDEVSPPPKPLVYNECVDGVCAIQDLSKLPAPPPPPHSPPTSPPKYEVIYYEGSDEFPGWAVGVLVVVGILALVSCLAIMFLVSREKKGLPVFSAINVTKEEGATATA